MVHSAQHFMQQHRIARLLIEEFGAEVDHEARPFGTALQAAAYQGGDDIVEILLEHGANPFANGGIYGSPLEAATEKGYQFILEAFLNHRSVDEAEKGVVRRALEKAKSLSDELARDSIVGLLEEKLSESAKLAHSSHGLHLY